MNGEYRIGIFASQSFSFRISLRSGIRGLTFFVEKDLTKGTELFLDYGPNFFLESNKAGGAARKAVGFPQSRKKASQASSRQPTEQLDCVDDPLDPDYMDPGAGPSEASSSQ